MKRESSASIKSKELRSSIQAGSVAAYLFLLQRAKTRFSLLKIGLTISLFCYSLISFGQIIKITVNNVSSKCFDNGTYNEGKYKKTIDSAFVIMNAVFNSPEFKSSVENNSFPCENRCCVSCRQNMNRISSKEILDSLFGELNVSMAIDLREKCRKKLGSTNYKEYKTIACLQNIDDDMPKLPLSYAIAVNLCHEYMHHIGFYHSSFDLKDVDKETPNEDGYRNDIAYRVGWDTYRLLKKWHEIGRKIEGL